MKMKTLSDLAVFSILGICISNAQAADADAPQPGTGPLANYTILKSTDYGKSMTRDFPAQTTAKQVVHATVPDLVAFFGQKPVLVGVYRDQKDQKSGCVFFSENLDGQPVKGLSVIKVADDATHEWIVFCRADAPKGEATKLLSLQKPSAQPAGDAGASPAGSGAGTDPAATAGAAQAGATPANPPTNDPGATHAASNAASAGANLQAIANVKLQTYNFPDGTGSVGLPDGWTCDSQNIGNSIVKGPADQTVGLDLSAIVDVPNGQSLRLLQMAHGNMATALIAPYSPDPVTALKNLIEAVNRIQRAKGGPTTTVDEVVSQKPFQSGMPNAHGAIIELKTTKTTSGVAKQFHSVQQFSVYSFNGGQDSWSYFASQLNAPEETFKQDFPVMNAIFASLHENAAAINAKGAAEQRQADQIMAQTNRMVAASNANIAQMQQQEVEADKSFADVDEGIRGYRKVYDTQTGEESDVNLGDVNGVVNALNETDPGRYVQVPLRDEVGN
jgi:hypothetical protein